MSLFAPRIVFSFTMEKDNKSQGQAADKAATPKTEEQLALERQKKEKKDAKAAAKAAKIAKSKEKQQAGQAKKENKPADNKNEGEVCIVSTYLELIDAIIIWF